MKLRLEEVIKDMDEKPVQGPDKKDMTLKDVCIASLMSSMETDKNMTGDKKVSLFSLAMSLKTNPDYDTTVEEVALIKDRIGKMYTQLVVGRAFELIEGTDG